jgi:ketosteroid isomerase-like protein
MSAAAGPHMAADIDRAALLTRLFVEALNARDAEGLATLVSDDVEFRNAAGGRPLHGREALERIVRAAGRAHLRLVRQGSEEIIATAGALRIAVPVLELVGSSEIRGTAIFEVTDDKIASFEVSSGLLRR